MAMVISRMLVQIIILPIKCVEGIVSKY